MNLSDRVLNFVVILILTALVGLATYYLFFFEQKSPAQNLIRKIEIAHEMKDDSQALSDIADFFSEYPNHPEVRRVYLTATEIFLSKRQLGNAEKYLQRALSSDNLSSSEKIRAAILLGELHIQTGIADSITLRTLEDAYLKASFANKEKLANLLGKLYLISGDNLNALRFFEEAKGENALIGKIRVELARKNWPSVQLLASRYQEIYPRGSHKEWVESLVQTNNKISNTTQPTLAIKGNDHALLPLLQNAVLSSNWIDALEISKKIIRNEDHSSDDEAYYLQGLIYYQLQQLPAAETSMKKISETYTNSKRAKQAKEWERIIQKEIQLSE